jgi:DNA-binding LytR/AlgR family response regulator
MITLKQEELAREHRSTAGLDPSLQDPRALNLFQSPQPKTERMPRLYRETAAKPLMNESGIESNRFVTRIASRQENKLVLVNLSDVLWIQSKGNFACLHTRDGDFDCRTTMNDLFVRLDPNCFLRVHRSAIVNLNHVVEFDLPRYGNGSVNLTNGRHLPISRTGRMALRRTLLTRSYE